MNALLNIDHWPWFLMLLPLVAFLYASVGHGGASGYLALMSLFGLSLSFMRPSALILNIFVSGISFWAFAKKGHFRRELFFPFALASIPMAFVGGYIQLDPMVYKRILGILLILAVLRIVVRPEPPSRSMAPTRGAALVIGGMIGLLSGMIGIGGGILLSPVILLLGWGNVKETAAVSALFILVNSVAGLGGLLIAGTRLSPLAVVLAAVALIGGYAGGRFGSGSRVGLNALSYVLAAVLLLASAKLLLL